jgi:hypothetical protein
MSETTMTVLFWMLVAHAVADYPLQGDFLARAKNHRAPVVAANGQAFPWHIALTSHALIHAGGVMLATGSGVLALCELVAHWLIDYRTSEGRTGGYVGDQALHVACKLAWVALYAVGVR